MFICFLLGFTAYFNSHPHEEDDLILVIYYNIYGNFNSHPHEEDDAILSEAMQDGLVFQLTSSRRG